MRPSHAERNEVTTRLPPEIEDEYSSWIMTPVSIHPGNSVMCRLSGDGEERFLKVVRKGWLPSAAAEAERTIWAGSYLPVPRILRAGATDDTTWFISSALDGIAATSQEFRSDVPALVRRLAAGLRTFHSAPVAACPFSFRLDDALALAERRLQEGAIDPARDFHHEHARLSAPDAVRRLIAMRPAVEDLVVCHGDYCVPNVLIDDGAIAGFVDLGELGVADRWWDLAVATWSLDWNFGPGYEEIFLDAYGTDLDAGRRRYYRLLYDIVS